MLVPTLETMQQLHTNQVVKVHIKESGEEFYLPLVETVSDYKWQLDCLNSRLKHPEWYKDTEDVQATIAKIKKWLAEHKPR